MTARPSFTELVDWVEGRLVPERADAVTAYVDTADPETADAVEWIRDFHHHARSMPLEQPPAELSARLRSVFTGLHEPQRDDDWSEASLLYDTRLGMAAAGVRSADDDGVHLAFDSELGRFVLDAVPAGSGEVDVQGMVALADSERSGIDLAFLERGTLRRAAHATADGRFDVRGVPTGVDELWLSSGGTRVRAVLDLRST
ncbi:hypothetical protein HNR19_002114 [Nocardioides thalensis]|uniref:Uncharacterized protein n=1 Tax=Nocardioides thalensis TaxID=1914755 RepID=A0A853C328_9ACTN|nr:hypothetical protein [Nocardioides thalensis]NYJ01416.1 hypothetical protein [Nocardioides thalensis]